MFDITTTTRRIWSCSSVFTLALKMCDDAVKYNLTLPRSRLQIGVTSVRPDFLTTECTCACKDNNSTQSDELFLCFVFNEGATTL